MRGRQDVPHGRWRGNPPKVPPPREPSSTSLGSKKFTIVRMNELLEEFARAYGQETGRSPRRDVPLREYSSFRIGGPADLFLEAASTADAGFRRPAGPGRPCPSPGHRRRLQPALRRRRLPRSDHQKPGWGPSLGSGRRDDRSRLGRTDRRADRGRGRAWLGRAGIFGRHPGHGRRRRLRQRRRLRARGLRCPGRSPALDGGRGRGRDSPGGPGLPIPPLPAQGHLRHPAPCQAAARRGGP